MKKSRLGKGLDALLGDAGAPTGQESRNPGSLRTLPLELLQRGKYQPRTRMDEQALAELAESIRAQGVVQPIVVRPIGEGRYEIIAGERRWRAAQIAGLDEIPVVLRDIPDDAAVAVALIENIQRENLNPIEEANALRRLIDEFDMTHQAVAETIGRSRTTVTNLLRLLSLEQSVLRLLEEGSLEMGHARALLALEPGRQGEAAREAVRNGLSVRQIERLVQRLQGRGRSAPPRAEAGQADVRGFEQDLSERLGARVRIRQSSAGRGQLIIDYHSLDELDGIVGRIR
jgi:ParB family transcriptional regulator, chromosome partitioning protein